MSQDKAIRWFHAEVQRIKRMKNDYERSNSKHEKSNYADEQKDSKCEIPIISTLQEDPNCEKSIFGERSDDETFHFVLKTDMFTVMFVVMEKDT